MLINSNPNVMANLAHPSYSSAGKLRTKRHGEEISLMVTDQNYSPENLIRLGNDKFPGILDINMCYDQKLDKTLLYVIDRRWSSLLKMDYYAIIGEVCGSDFKNIVYLAEQKAELITEEIYNSDVYHTIKKFLGFDLSVWFDSKYLKIRRTGDMGNFLYSKRQNYLSIDLTSKYGLVDIFAARDLVNMGILDEPIKQEKLGSHVRWVYNVIRFPTEEEIGISYTSKKIAEDLKYKLKFKYVRHKLALYLKYDGICQLCELYYPYHGMTVDHIIPRGKQNCNNFMNLQIACETCNKLKSNMLMEEFRKKYTKQQLHKAGAKNRKKLIGERHKRGMDDLKKVRDELNQLSKNL